LIEEIVIGKTLIPKKNTHIPTGLNSYAKQRPNPFEGLNRVIEWMRIFFDCSEADQPRTGWTKPARLRKLFLKSRSALGM
jgi:hypothetical protein